MNIQFISFNFVMNLNISIINNGELVILTENCCHYNNMILIYDF